jgi:signal transduction histidine kinase
MPTIQRRRGVGLNLGLRLYLLLIAIFVPTFGIYYFYSLRIIEAVHDGEVDDVIRVTSFRIESWVSANGLPPDPEAPERNRLSSELKRIAEEPNGIERIVVYSSAGGVPLSFFAGFNVSPTANPTTDDIEAAARERTLKSEIRRGGLSLLSASTPLFYRSAVQGVMHVELLPEKVGSGPRIPDLRVSLILAAAGMMLVVGIGVAFFFQVSVGRPIHRLVDAMTRSTGGELSPVTGVHTAEFRFVADAYNGMILQLKASVEQNRKLIEQIKVFNEELKEKIGAATRELAAKNEQIEIAHEKLFLLQRQMATVEKLAALGQIATLIAHELGTPLNAISSHLQLLLQDAAGSPGIFDRLKVIDGQVERLTGIVHQVLKAMRMPPPRYDRVLVQKTLSDVVGLILPVAQKRRIHIDLRLTQSLPAIQADADQLEQVFMNLFTNAMDAMKEGGTLTVQAEFLNDEAVARLARDGAPALHEGSCVRIDVTDTGCGMDEETARHAFEPFYTTKGSGTDPGSPGGPGVGLGLSICRQIVKNHRGDISVRSQRGAGTTFSIYLPLEPGKIMA